MAMAQLDEHSEDILDISMLFDDKDKAQLPDGSEWKCCCSQQEGECVLAKLGQVERRWTAWEMEGCKNLKGATWHSFRSPNAKIKKCLVATPEGEEFFAVKEDMLEHQNANTSFLLRETSALQKGATTHRGEYMANAEDLVHDIAAYYCSLMGCSSSIDDIVMTYFAATHPNNADRWLFKEGDAVIHPFESRQVVMSDHAPVSVEIGGFGDQMPQLFTWNIEGFGTYGDDHANNSLMMQRLEELKTYLEDIKMNTAGTIIVLQEVILKPEKDRTIAQKNLDRLAEALGSQVTWVTDFDNGTSGIVYDSQVWEPTQRIPIARNGKISSDDVTKYSTYFGFTHKITKRRLDLVNIHLKAVSPAKAFYSGVRKVHLKELTYIWKELRAQLGGKFYNMLSERSLILLGDFNDKHGHEKLIADSFRGAFPWGVQLDQHDEL